MKPFGYVVVGILMSTVALAADEKSPQPSKDASTKESSTSTAQSSRQDLVERGRYITHSVAMCIICHSPHRPDGSLVIEQVFHGAPIPIHSPFENQDWATRSPDLTAIPEIWGEKELARFLQTGTPPRGAPPRLPMPPFRMSEEDANAVAAYLSSLR
jgi:mono/diheme cytochrome c family protein